MTLRECYAESQIVSAMRPQIVLRYTFGASAEVIAAELRLDRHLVAWLISTWWHETAGRRRGPLPLMRRAA